MKPGEETLGEASQMLCNILKNSRQEGADDQVRDNNNTLKTLDTTLPNLSPLNTLRAASDLENRDDMNASSLEQSLSSKAAPVEDSTIQSVHGNSGDESDVDTSCGRTEDKDEAQKENDREQDEYCSTNSASPSDSKEAKRARVENILTSIRQCPQTGYDSLTPVTFSDMKRQKRKQPQPQQHEVKTPLAPKAKYRKLERLVLHKHILQLQRQLQAVKKTFNEISRCSSDDSEEDKDASLLHEDLENEESSQGSVIIATHDNDGAEPTAQRSSAGGRHVEETEHHSPLSLCLNGKVTTREGSENTKYVSKPADSYTHQNGHLSVPVYQPTLSSQFVSLTLKSEIIQAVKRAVDSAVITVLEKHVGSINNHQQMNHRGSEPDFQPEREQRFLPSKTSKKEDDMQQPLTIPKPRLEREALKEAISNSQTERPAELIIPFHDHLRLLERLGHPRQQPPEKQSLFDPLLPRSESSDLIKPHINAALPFPPFPPYSGYMHAGLLPPLFPAPEPEQTEALPLVVSSATKKKRTKVTDTRLATKGKCTPPQDSDQAPATVEENGEERLHPLSSPFHHPYLPPVLPTSVAITNPSLHQSELFSAFRFQENSFEAAVASSPGPEQDLAKSPQQDSGQGVDSVKSEGGVDSPAAPASPVDGQPTNKTSILTPMHLRKAKLMFFYTRYPNSGVLKTYFPDVAFNKNNTAQLVKWFSNFREFYYIQMEKFARQAATDGHSQAEDLTVPRDSDLFRQLNNHYNRNNHIEAPESFRLVSETTLKEFFTAISSKRDVDSSWKKAIYKVIARLDEPVPEFLKSPSWMQHLGEA